MKKNLMVSIIIPIFNSESFLSSCLDSVINQTYRNLEIILINDASTDNSNQICCEYKNKDSRIKYYKFNKNKGVSYARNYGLNKSSGNYVFFLDSDDCISNSTIYDLLYQTKNNTITRVYNFEKDDIFNIDEYVHKFIYGEVLGSCWGYLINRELCKDVQFDVNVSYMEDSLFMLEILLKYDYVKILKGNYYRYNNNDQSLTNVKNNQKKRLLGYFYSIDKMIHMLNKRAIVFDAKKICKRKIALINYEINLLNDIKQVNSIINCKDIKKSIYINNQYNILLKIYYNYLLILYWFLKKTARKMKNKISK